MGHQLLPKLDGLEALLQKSGVMILERYAEMIDSVLKVDDKDGYLQGAEHLIGLGS